MKRMSKRNRASERDSGGDASAIAPCTSTYTMRVEIAVLSLSVSHGEIPTGHQLCAKSKRRPQDATRCHEMPHTEEWMHSRFHAQVTCPPTGICPSAACAQKHTPSISPHRAVCCMRAVRHTLFPRRHIERHCVAHHCVARHCVAHHCVERHLGSAYSKRHASCAMRRASFAMRPQRAPPHAAASASSWGLSSSESPPTGARPS